MAEMPIIYMTQTTCSRSQHVMNEIQKLTLHLIEDIAAGRSLSIPLRMRSTNPSQGIQFNASNSVFPSSSPQFASRFAILLDILRIVYDALVSGVIISKREIFYQNPDLFQHQAVVDRYLNAIAFTFGVSRNDLNVTAEVKGLLAGPLILRGEDGTLDKTCHNSAEGISVPISSQLSNLSKRSDQPDFLLLVEKKAIFHVLSRSLFHVRHNCILLTGQGYPDIATRSFLNYFNTILAPGTPCFALVDFDPDGLCIYNTYRSGSQALAHGKDLMVEGLKFLGLRSGDAFWMACGIDTDGQDVDSIMVDTSEVMELQYITLRERQRARGLLGRLVDEMASDSSEDELQVHMLEKWDWHESGTDSEKRQNVQDLKREVQICLLLGYKVELEILERRPGGLAHWLLSQIEQ